MQTRRKSENAAKTQLLSQVTRTYSKLKQENEEPVRRCRSTTPKSVQQRRLRSQAKKELSKSETSAPPVRGQLFLGSRSFKDDKELFIKAKDNPAVLAYLQDKLIQEKQRAKTILDEDALFFAMKVIKNETNLKSNNNGHSNKQKPTIEKPKLLDSVVPGKSDQQQLSPCFGQRKRTNEVVVQPSAKKYRVLNQSVTKLKNKRRMFSNFFCFNVLFIHLAVIALILFSPAKEIEEPTTLPVDTVIETEVVQFVPEMPLKEEDRLQNLSLEFKKINQELEAYILDIENPKPVPYDLQSLLPFSVVSLVLQLFLWMVYAVFKSL